MSQRLIRTLGTLGQKLENDIAQHKIKLAQLEGQLAAVEGAIHQVHERLRQEQAATDLNPLSRQQFLIFWEATKKKLAALEGSRVKVMGHLNRQHDVLKASYQELKAMTTLGDNLKAAQRQEAQRREDVILDDMGQRCYHENT